MNYPAPCVGEMVDLPRAGLSPALVIGSSSAARKRGEQALGAAGFRIAGSVDVGAASLFIDDQPAISVVLIEIDEDNGSALDKLLCRIDSEADAGCYGAVISCGRAELDAVAARVSSSRVEVLVEAEEIDRLAALSLAAISSSTSPRAYDVAADNSAAQLRHVREEMARMAATLATLAKGPDEGPATPRARADTDQPMPEVSRATVNGVIRARRLRSRFFPEDLFADPAWDMLLDLLQNEIAQIRVPVSSLCIAASVPATTALRWIKSLTDSGVFTRRADPRDGRRVFVELAPATSRAIRNYFSELGQALVI